MALVGLVIILVIFGIFIAKYVKLNKKPISNKDRFKMMHAESVVSQNETKRRELRRKTVSKKHRTSNKVSNKKNKR